MVQVIISEFDLPIEHKMPENNSPVVAFDYLCTPIVNKLVMRYVPMSEILIHALLLDDVEKIQGVLRYANPAKIIWTLCRKLLTSEAAKEHLPCHILPVLSYSQIVSLLKGQSDENLLSLRTFFGYAIAKFMIKSICDLHMKLGTYQDDRLAQISEDLDCMEKLFLRMQTSVYLIEKIHKYREIAAESFFRKSEAEEEQRLRKKEKKPRKRASQRQRQMLFSSGEEFYAARSSLEWDKCPLTGRRFTEPVIAADGITYDASSLKEFDLSCSPLLRTPMQHCRLTPNLAIKTAISDGL